MKNKLQWGWLCFVLLSACGGGGGGDTTTPPPPPAATAPAIATQPTDQTVTVGAAATFTVSATGTAPLSYQWKKSGTAIDGATAASYTTPATVAGDNGATFVVVVTNSAGNVTSSSATLTVNVPPPGPTAPTITTQPTAQTVVVAGMATFTVVAAGTAPLSYQWQKGGVNIDGATVASYTTPPTVIGDNGATFAVVVTNSAGSVTSNSVALTVQATAVAPTITTQPTAQTVVAPGTATFTVVAAGAAPLTYQWRKGGVNIGGATAASYTTPATMIGDSGTTFDVVVSNSAGTVTSTAVALTVNAASAVDVVTYHYDKTRSGHNANETSLTTANVNQATFGLKQNFVADGRVDGQPLFLSQLSIGGTPHNVLFFGTEHGSIYAVDADTYTMLWKVSLIPAGQVVSDDIGCTQITPEIGVTSTPVIDRTAGAHGVLYAVSMSADVSGVGPYHQILHAIDVTTGADVVAPREITATFTAPLGGMTTFDPGKYVERAALLLDHGTIYTSWSSHCDDATYGGWIITFNQATLAQNGALNVGPAATAPTGTGPGSDQYTASGPGIWMSGNGPAANAAGDVYLVTGNGPFDTTLDTNGRPQGGNYSQSILKLHSTGSALTIADYFALKNGLATSATDLDLGGSGGVLLPQMTDFDGDPVDNYVVPGKDGHVYVVDQSNLGKFSPTANNIYQDLASLLQNKQVRAPPVYFNNRLYFGPRDIGMVAVNVNLARLVGTPSSTTSTIFGYPGTSPSISANGTTNGIVWAYKHGNAGELHAYDATNLATELYNTTQAAGNRDSFGVGNKFITPMVADGKVFLGTSTGVAIFGLNP